MADHLGQRLGNYRLIRLLGQGGFAEVYLGQHLRLGTQAAIKVLYARLANEEDVEGFEKEARTVAHLKHPNIVRILDYDVEDDTPFLIMDYAPGGSLRKRHPKRTILPFTTIISYARQIADALEYAHDRRITHRDVKPENMLVGEHDELLLADFGIAVVAQSSRYQSTLNMVGTMAYMAPEQIQGKPRAASDQYSLGIVVYEWLSGDRPFHGSLTEIVAQHLAAPPPSLCEKIPALSLDMEQVVMTALAKDPKERFSSVRAFSTALEQAWQTQQVLGSASKIQATKPPSVPIIQPTRETPSSRKAPPPLSIPEAKPSLILGSSLPGSQSTQGTASSSQLTSLPSSDVTDVSLSSTPIGPSGGSISRRTMILGLGLAGLAVAGGAVAWLAFSQEQHSSFTSGQTLTPVPMGTLFYTYFGHLAPVRAVAWSPDMKRIASGGDDKTVQVWDAANGSNVFTYRGHSDAIWILTWSPNGKRIASGSLDKTVQVWQAS